MRDVRERKSMDERLKKAKLKYRHLFENSTHIVVLVNMNGEIIDFNDNTLKFISGYTKHDLIGVNFLNLNFIAPRDFPALITMFDDLFLQGISEPIELQIGKSKKMHLGIEMEWVEIQCSIHRVGDEDLIQVIIRNITERKKTDRNLK